MSITKADIGRPFKLHGLFLAPDASSYLLNIIDRIEEMKRQKVLRRLVDTIMKQKIDNNRITKALCEWAVNECKAERSAGIPIFYVIDAYEVPRYKYCTKTRKFTKLEDTGFDTLFPKAAQVKTFMYANRYEVIHQRVLRHQIFSSTEQASNYRLRPIEYLLASGSRLDSVIVLGVISQLREGDWHLEDPTGIVRLNLQEATFHEAGADSMLVLLGETRLDRPGCLDRLAVLFSGYASCPPVAFILTGDFISPEGSGIKGSSYTERRNTLRQLLLQLFLLFQNAFYPSGILPPSPDSHQPQLVLLPGPSDPLSAPAHILPRPSLSAKWLFADQPLTRSRHSWSEAPTWLQLVSNPCRLRLYTKEVVIFRAEYSRLLMRHCIHLPSRLEMREAMEEDAAEHQASIQTQLPEDEENRPPATYDFGLNDVIDVPEVVKRLSPANASAKLGQGLARCLTSQAHLLPLPGHIAPVFWAYDQALALNPLPDLVVAVEPNALADLNASEQWFTENNSSNTPTAGCRFVNPGTFGQIITTATDKARQTDNEATELQPGTPLHTEYNFKVYYPRTGVIEDSRLPVE